MHNVTDLCETIMKAVIETGVITDSNIKIAADIMNEEVKALFTGDKYQHHRECIQDRSLHDGYILAYVIVECVDRIRNHS